MNKQQAAALLLAAQELNSIVDGPFKIDWRTSSRVRLTDTPQWCAFYVALSRAAAKPKKK